MNLNATFNLRAGCSDLTSYNNTNFFEKTEDCCMSEQEEIGGPTYDPDTVIDTDTVTDAEKKFVRDLYVTCFEIALKAPSNQIVAYLDSINSDYINDMIHNREESSLITYLDVVLLTKDKIKFYEAVQKVDQVKEKSKFLLSHLNYCKQGLEAENLDELIESRRQFRQIINRISSQFKAWNHLLTLLTYRFISFTSDNLMCN